MQVTQVQQQINLLYERTQEENSKFSYGVGQAKFNIDMIADTYHEVLNRDSNEDDYYIPKPKEIK